MRSPIWYPLHMLCVCSITFSTPEHDKAVNEWNHNERKKKGKNSYNNDQNSRNDKVSHTISLLKKIEQGPPQSKTV